MLGQTENGIYADDCKGMHSDIIQQYYGVTGEPARRRHSQTGAGHLADEDDADDRDEPESSDDEANIADAVGTQIAEDQQANIRHEPVPVPEEVSPFADHATEQLFGNALAVYRTEDGLPDGYGVLLHEMENGYQSLEVLRTGKRGGNEISITLSEVVWRPRAEYWAKALHLMNHMLHTVGLDDNV